MVLCTDEGGGTGTGKGRGNGGRGRGRGTMAGAMHSIALLMRLKSPSSEATSWTGACFFLFEDVEPSLTGANLHLEDDGSEVWADDVVSGSI